MKVPRSTDARVLHTRAALRNALLALIVERGWDGIGIRDICQRAGVGRSTFYTHFADKEELLFSGFDDLRRRLRPSFRTGHAPLDFARGLIEHAGENKRMFRALIGKRASQLATRQMLRVIADLIREDLASSLPGEKLEPIVQFLAGGLIELLVWWVETRSSLAGEDIDSIFQRFAASAIVTAPRRS
jgi:AcrR family transcriptional regulator